MTSMVATVSSGSSLGGLVVVVLAALAVLGVRAQLNPFTRCKRCGGRPPSDAAGENYHRCRRCGGASERLRFGAWLMLQLGIPVPRAKPGATSNRWGR